MVQKDVNFSLASCGSHCPYNAMQSYLCIRTTLVFKDIVYLLKAFLNLQMHKGTVSQMQCKATSTPELVFKTIVNLLKHSLNLQKHNGTVSQMQCKVISASELVFISVICLSKVIFKFMLTELPDFFFFKLETKVRDSFSTYKSLSQNRIYTSGHFCATA